ncbi:MAG: GNAT family N-acetyltransferase [Spirochaetaceae bacterium]|nr:GNAT family N-acetyltransferase [Spirochaetaceae bacterium]
MMYRADRVGEADREAFVAYCLEHRFDHDESFLSERDLAGIVFDSDEVAFALRSAEGGTRILGAAALMITPAFREVGKARFRIIHVEPSVGAADEADAYRVLVEAVLPFAKALSFAYLFLPERARRVADIILGLGFRVERYSWLLERSLDQVEPTSFPEGYSLERIDPSEPEASSLWCGIVNLAFERLAGHTRMTSERLLADRDAGLEFPGSYLILRDAGGIAVGLALTVKDVDDAQGKSALLGPIAVLPTLQGRGLGRSLLRAGMMAARDAGFSSCVLTVNSENNDAAELYLSEGFTRKDVYVCYRRDLVG